MRKIPVTMATQHPDNARPSIWTDKCFVSTNGEIEECYRCFLNLASMNICGTGKASLSMKPLLIVLPRLPRLL